MASGFGWCVIASALILLTLRLIGREEAALVASQGESYCNYQKAVPRLIPALRPRLPPSGGSPRWGQALAGEAFMWGFVLAMLAYAATMRWDLASGLLVLSFVARLAAAAMEKRRRSMV